MHFIYFSFLILILNLDGSNTDTSYFNVVRNNKIIGELKVTKSRKDGITTYNSITHVKVHVLKEVDVFYKFETNMYNNQLYSSDAIIEVNGKTHDHTITKQVENQYLIQRKDKKKKFISSSIKYPEILLLFKEPIGVTQSFSEKAGDFHSIYSVEKHIYKKINPKGRENYYYYENGKLSKAKVDAGVIKFELVSRDQ